MIRKIKIFFVLLFLSFTVLHAGKDSLVNIVDLNPNIKNNSEFNITLNKGINTDKKYYWLYYNYDKSELKNKDYRDTNFQIIDYPIVGIGYEESDFKGLAWFRLKFKVDHQSIKKPFFINLKQQGALEIYLDGDLVKKFGKIYENGKGEEMAIIENYYQIPLVVNDTLEHVLALRYSLSDYKSLAEDDNFNSAGVSLFFGNTESVNELKKMSNIINSVTSMLAAFFFALFVIHILLFYFNKELIFNLYYSLFLLFLSLCFLEVSVLKQIGNVNVFLFLQKFEILFFPSCCFFLITLMYRFFKRPINWNYYVYSIIFVLFILSALFFKEHKTTLFITLILYSYFCSFFLSIKGIRKKLPGARFLGWGILMFTIFLIGGSITIVFLSKLLGHSSSIWGILILVCFILGTLSIPLSMTTFLAYDFAATNKSLKNQLIANEELSRKSIEQEKEKQELLANQNKNLEHQVLERTKEIASQNKVLELQKKEITDSINYAKRIQQALLPDLENIQRALPNSFVFYLPKDIVSGDFYFFHENVSQKKSEILIAAADCTGHGVPGSLMSMIVHEKLENAVQQTSEPAEILQKLNKQVKDALKQNITENASRDGCDIALCKITDTTVTYSGAYRPLYVYNKTGEFTEIKATKTAIAGITPYDQIFAQTELKIKDLKAIYLFSDGYADQFGGEKSKKLTTKKFKLLLSGIVNMPIHEQKREIESFFTKWRGEVEQIDDVLIIGILF